MTERSMSRGRKRLGAAALITAMGAASVAGIAPASAAPPPAQSTEAFCANVPEANPFTDVSDNVDNIVCMAFTEITTGLAGGTTYGPGNTVTRAQMASFIARMIDTAGELALVDVPELPATGPNAFTDDNGLAPHEANINRLAAAGVVAGIGGGRYAPDQPVTRAQMATFINNAQAFIGGGEANRFVSSEDYFTDDEAQTAHEANINGLAGAGIVQGGPGGIAQTLYGPVLPVNRSQMASFVIRYLGVLEEAGTIKPAGTPPTNQTIAVTPADEATTFVSTNAVDNTGRRAYTAKATTANVDIVLLPASYVAVSATGQVSFRDSDSTANRADVAVTHAGIELALGTSVGTQYLDNVQVPANGEVTFSVDSLLADSIIPVVFVNPSVSATPVLTLDADNEPTVAFGVGGRTNWVPPEAANGVHTVEVDSVNAAANYFVASTTAAPVATGTFFYDDNDAFRINGGVNRPIAAFEGLLTAGDILTVTYDRDEADQSIYNVTTDVVPPPTGLTVTMSDLDSDGAADDATLTWTASAQVDARYNVYVDTVADGTFVTPGDTVVQQDVAAYSTTVNNANGTVFHVGAESVTSGERSTGDPQVTATTAADAAPVIGGNGAFVDHNAGAAGATTGDVWVLYFSEAVTVASDASLQINGGPVVDRSAGHSFSLDASGRVLTITLAANLSSPTAYPANITLAGGIRDADEGGKPLDVTTPLASDVVLEDDGPEVVGETFSTSAGETTALILFNEKVLNEASSTASYVFVDATVGGTVALQSASLGADGRTVTLTFSGPLGVNDTITVLPGLTDDDGQDTLIPGLLTVVS